MSLRLAAPANIKTLPDEIRKASPRWLAFSGIYLNARTGYFAIGLRGNFSSRIAAF